VRYFAATDITGTCFEASVPKFSQVLRPGACKECATLPRFQGPPDRVTVKRINRTKPAISFTSWVFGVIHIDFLNAIDSTAQRLRIGDLFDAGGQKIEDFRTFTGMENVIPRGGKESQHRICSACGAFVYSASTDIPVYVTTASLDFSIPLYEFGTMELLLREDLLNLVEENWKQAIDFTEIPVRDEPLDGLPPALSSWSHDSLLADYKPNLPSWMRRKQ
jgi:hypothetical protein